MGFVCVAGKEIASHTITLSDWTMFAANLVLPKRPVGKVVPQGHAGANGKWPEYIPRKNGDSRCSCPALNAMANHGEYSN